MKHLKVAGRGQNHSARCCKSTPFSATQSFLNGSTAYVTTVLGNTHCLFPSFWYGFRK